MQMFIFVSSYAQRIWQKLFANDTTAAVVTNLEAIASPLEQPGPPVTTTDLPVQGPLPWKLLGWGEVGEPEWCIKHIWAFWLWNMIYGPRSKDSQEFRELLCALPEIVITFWGTRFIYVLLWACKRWNRLLAGIEQILLTAIVEVVATLSGRRGPFLRKVMAATWNCVRYGPRFMWIFVWELRRSLRAVYGRHREFVAQ
ncbi:hypothetical protein V492_01556 [Pseudogymnoascus sp. VKM F-4246]|nr:hypothetical protein V492_01556 [Pseudogymnoascus sp. VKM F-4246]